MSTVDKLVWLLEHDLDEGIAALAEESIYSKDFLYGVYCQQQAEGNFDASYFVDVTLECDW